MGERRGVRSATTGAASVNSYGGALRFGDTGWRIRLAYREACAAQHRFHARALRQPAQGCVPGDVE